MVVKPLQGLGFYGVQTYMNLLIISGESYDLFDRCGQFGLLLFIFEAWQRPSVKKLLKKT